MTTKQSRHLRRAVGIALVGLFMVVSYLMGAWLDGKDTQKTKAEKATEVVKGAYTELNQRCADAAGCTPGPPAALVTKGDPGPAGRSGDPGDRGARGLQGDRGERGLTVVGPKGDEGDQGLTGFPGASTTGPPGRDGLDGPAGPKGDKGDKGDAGLTVKGDKGDAGTNGTNGTDGAPGTPGSAPYGIRIPDGQGGTCLATDPDGDLTYECQPAPQARR